VRLPHVRQSNRKFAVPSESGTRRNYAASVQFREHAHQSQTDAKAGSGVLGKQVHEHLLEPARVGMQPYGCVGSGCRNSVIALITLRFKGLGRGAYDHAQIYPLALEPQAAAANPCHIRKARGELRQLAHLAFD
jgi:hypothetical protein